MAWFGGLSKLTDEISNLGNLTREAITDTLSSQDEAQEVSEVAEEAIQRRSSVVPELEEKVKVQEDVIETLKRENDQLMKRLNDQLLSLDQASPRSTIARSFQSAADTWGDFEEDEENEEGRTTPGARRPSGPLFPGGDFELDNEKEETQNELKALGSKIDLLEKENEDLLKETAEIPELRSRIKQLHKENNLLIKSTDKFEREVENSKKLLDEQKESISRLESQVSQLQHDLAAQSSTIAELTQENTQLREAVDSTQDENSNLSTGIEQLDMQHSRDLQDLMDSKRDAERRNVALQEEVTRLREALETAPVVPSPVSGSAGTQTDPELPLPLEPCQTGSDNSDEISEAYDMLQNDYDELKAKFDEVVKRTKVDTSNQTEEPSSTSGSSGKNGFELVPTSEDYSEKIRALNEEVSHLKTKENELHTRIEELEEKLQQKLDDEKSVSYQIEEKSIEISQLTEHNRFLQKEMDLMKDKLRDFDENVPVSGSLTIDIIARKDELIEELKAELEHVQRDLNEKESELTEWTQGDAWGNAKGEKQQLEKCIEEKQELNEIIQDLQQLNGKLESDLVSLKTEYSEQTEQLAQKTALVSELTSKLVTVESILTQKEQELEGWNENENWRSSENHEGTDSLKKENEEIKVKLAQLESENSKLKAHSESLQKQLVEKEMEIEEWGNNDSWGGGSGDSDMLISLQQQNAALNEKILELQKQLASLEEDLKKKESYLEDWGQEDDWGTENTAELNNLRTKCKEMENQIEDLRTKEELLKQCLAEKENEFSEWGENSDWGTASSSDLDTLREESGLLKEKLSEQKSIISKLKSQLEAKQQSTSSSYPVEQIQEGDSRVEILSRENEGLRTQVEQLRLVIENNYVEESDQMNNPLYNGAQLTAEKERLDEEVHALTREKNDLKKKLELAVEKQKGLEEEITQLEEDTTTLREQLESKDQVDDSIEKTLRNEIQGLHMKLATSESLVSQLQVEKEALDAKYEELKEKYAQVNEKQKGQSASDNIDIDTLIKNLQSKEEELFRLLDEKSTLDNIKVEKENLEVQLDNLNTNYQDKVNTLIQKNHDLEEKLAELNNLQHNKNNDINDLNKRICLFEENNAFLQRTIVDLERNLDEKLKELNEKEISYNEKIESSNIKLLEKIQENDSLKTQIVSQAEISQLVKQEQAQLAATPVDDSVIVENQQLKAHLETFKQQTDLTIENLQNQIVQKDYEISNKVTEIDKIKERCKEYEEKCNELQSTLTAKLTDFSTKEQLNKNKINELSTILESVQTENTSTKEINEELKALTHRLKETSKSCEEDRKILDQYKERIKELDATLAQEIESKKNIVQTLEMQVKEMHDKLCSYAHVDNELAQYRSQVQQLEESQANLLAEKTRWIHEFEIKNNALSDLQKQLNDYNNKLTHSNQVDHELNEVKAQIQELEQQKQKLLMQIQTESISSDSLRNDLQRLRDEFQQTKVTNDNLVQEKSSLIETQTALESQLREFIEKENQYKHRFSEYEETQKKLYEKIARQNENIAKLNTISAPSDAYSSIDNILKEKDTILNEMLKKCEAKDVELEKMQKSLDQHMSEKYQFEKEALELRNNVSAYESEIQLLRSTTEDLQYQLQEKEKLIGELEEMKQSFFIGDSKDSIRKSPQDSSEVAMLRSELTELRGMNQQLVQTVTLKHGESWKYHQEIQRLNGVLSEELPKLKDLSDRVVSLEKSLKMEAEALAAKERQLAETQEQLSLAQSQVEELTQLMSSNDRPEADGEPAQERELLAQHVATVETSREREELAARVQTLQDEKAMLLNEINDLRLNQNNLYNENERLKQHLLTIEEENTSELLKAEQNMQELSGKLREAEERVKTSASAYTSASVRTNQQLESLTFQVKSLSEQKEKLQEKLNSAEDLVEKHKVSLTNLQIVLEQFQADKDNEIAQGLEFLQGELNNSYAKNNELTQVINNLQYQLQDARDSLSASERLSEQLNQKSQIIQELTDKVNHLMEELSKNEVKLKEVNNGGKVDKCLVTNMIVNFLTAPSRPARNQALQILASVIDMTSQDRQRIGLESPQAYNPNQSLSEAFIQFLENESSPRAKSQTSTPASRRTSSTTSPLLFPENALPSLPQFPPMGSGSILKDVLHSDS